MVIDYYIKVSSPVSQHVEDVFSALFHSASVLLKQAEELAARYPNTIPIMLDASSQEGHLDSLVTDHDLVIRYQLLFYSLCTQSYQFSFFCCYIIICTINWQTKVINSVELMLLNFPSVSQHAALLFPSHHRQTLHKEEGEHGDCQLPESCYEGAAEKVTNKNHVEI